MKKKNDWVDTLSDEEIKRLLTSVPKLEDVPEKADMRVRQMIHTYNFSRQEGKWADIFTHILFFFKKSKLKYVIASAASICLILFAGIIFLYNTQKGVRIKGGGSGLYIYLKTEVEIIELNDLDFVQEGDTIQLSYRAGNKNYGSIFSVDGRGVITYHYPFRESGVIKLIKPDEIYLDHSYQLDDAPDYEIFFFITSSDYFQVDEILEKLLIVHNIYDYEVPKIKNIDIKAIRLIKKRNNEQNSYYIEGTLDTSHPPTPLVPGESYYWAVWAWDEDGLTIIHSSSENFFTVQ